MNRNVKIKVLHLISSSSFLGAERVVCELARHTNTCSFICVVGLLGTPKSVVSEFKEQLNSYNIQVVRFCCDCKLSIKSIREIAVFAKNNSVDIIHSHGYKTNIYSILSRMYLNNTKAITTNHNWISNTIKEKIYKYIDIKILKKYTYIVAVSQELKDKMVSCGIESSKVNVLLNGIFINYNDNDYYYEKKKIGISANCFVIGCVASLIPVKAHIDLLRAFAMLLNTIPNSRLVLVGDGPLYDYLNTISKQIGIESNVTFLGYRNDAIKLLHTFDVFSLVSHSEGLPMAMLEAMAASLPVVVSSVGAIPQVITHMKNGILVTPGNITEIFNAFVTLADDPDLRKNLGCNARKQVVANYSVERMVKDYEELYDKVLGSDT